MAAKAKREQMNKDYVIFQENGLFGVKNQNGEALIQPQYMEMQPFSCGLSLVRNTQYQYAYIDITNKPIVHFGLYSWCDPQFTCGFARVMKYRWGIIDTLGNVVVPLKYDKIWVLQEQYLLSVKAFIGDKEERLNLHELATNVILDGLTYICTYSVEAFKDLVNCQRLFVKARPKSGELYFTYGANIGSVFIHGIPKEPVISIVANSSGKIFPLLMEKSDIGKSTLLIKKEVQKASCGRSVQRYECDNNYEAESWEDQWLNAFEGDESNYWNIE